MIEAGDLCGGRASRIQGSAMSLALFFGLLAMMVVGACGRSPQVAKSENAAPDLVLIVTVDSLRWDMLGAYGDASGVSPTIDGLADQAHVFTHAYATSSWTKPSIASLLTGSIVSHHLVFLSTLVKERAVEYLKAGIDSDHERMYLRGNVLPSDLPLVHESLDGYLKAAFVENVHLRPELGFARGWDEFRNFPSRKSEEGIPGNAAAINHDVIEFLDAHKNQRAVVWIHYFDVHWPYGPFEPYGAEFLSDGADLLPDPYTYEGLERMVHGEYDPDGLVAKTVLPGIYRAGVREFDERLGQLFDQLHARDLFDASLIIVTSDHGDEFFLSTVNSATATISTTPRSGSLFSSNSLVSLLASDTRPRLLWPISDRPFWRLVERGIAVYSTARVSCRRCMENPPKIAGRFSSSSTPNSKT